jgi:hypothetical protein
MKQVVLFFGVKQMAKLRIFSIIMLSLFNTGCAYMAESPQDENMYVKASALSKLSASVESTVRYKNPPANISDEDLLLRASAHDPALLNPFANYTLKVLRADGHSAVLMCSKDASQALLEDAGCTAAMDLHRWKSSNQPCAFSLNLSQTCAAP